VVATVHASADLAVLYGSSGGLVQRKPAYVMVDMVADGRGLVSPGDADVTRR
jgi:hypothetical protein